jgi:uncharacterized oxidoreductase
MATSVVAMGKVRVARNEGEQLKPGILLDGEGRPTTDPGAMYRQPRGAALTFGEHKGYALAFVCEMLAGALSGSGTMRPERQGRGTATNGMLTIVIDPSRLVDRQWLRENRGNDRLHHRLTAVAPRRTGADPRRPRAPHPRRAPRQRRAGRRRNLTRARRSSARHQRADRDAVGPLPFPPPRCAGLSGESIAIASVRSG